MNTLPDHLLTDFSAFHDRVTSLWTQANATTDLKPLEDFCHSTYHGTFCGPGMDEASPFNREESLAGMRSAIQSGNNTWIANRTIRMRSATEAVAFYERFFGKDGQSVARLFVVENWRLVDGEWKLMRETVEQVVL